MMSEPKCANRECEWGHKHRGYLLLDIWLNPVAWLLLFWSCCFVTVRLRHADIKKIQPKRTSGPSDSSASRSHTWWYVCKDSVLTGDTVWPGRGLWWREAGRGCTGWFCWAAPGLCCCCCCCCWDWTESWGKTAHRRATVRTPQELSNLI